MERLLYVVTVADIEPVVATASSLLDNVPTFQISERDERIISLSDHLAGSWESEKRGNYPKLLPIPYSLLIESKNAPCPSPTTTMPVLLLSGSASVSTLHILLVSTVIVFCI